MIMADLRVLIVAANPLARSGLAVLVEGMTGMKIVGATGVAEAASLAGQLLPDAVLLDAGDGEAEELDAIARLATAQPGLPIVALASEHGAVSQALTFGASALLPAAVDGETLAAALRASARGLVSIARADLSALLPQEERIEPELRAPAETVTPRELEVLQWMALVRRPDLQADHGSLVRVAEHIISGHVEERMTGPWLRTEPRCVSG